MKDQAKHVFVSYVREDAEQVDKLCALLDAAQIPYWRDRVSLAPGDQWKQRIRDAIRSGALVFLACFSEQSRARAKSYMNEELTLAVDEFRKLPPGATWLIPVRFDSGDIPEWDLGAGRTLSDLNYADLYGEHYSAQAVKLTATISRVMGTAGPDAATVRASVEEADASERPAMMRRLTKELILDPARRIELDDLISEETRSVLSAMQDEERFPTQRLEGAGDAQVVRSAEVVAAYWRLAEPLSASLQVATRWADDRGLASWVVALRAITSEALKPKPGMTALLNLRHIPALTGMFTVALAATGQSRWDNFKTLLIDLTLPSRHREGRQPLIQLENPWTPFNDSGDRLPNVVARTARTGNEPSTVLQEFVTNKAHNYYTPTAEWLHSILRAQFSDQYPDDDAYDSAFDRAEIMLGLVSQDIENAQAAASEANWKGRSKWFGRSTWRNRQYGNDALAEISFELNAQGVMWPPLTAGLFGGDLDRATVALGDYSEDFNTIANSRF